MAIMVVIACQDMLQINKIKRNVIQKEDDRYKMINLRLPKLAHQNQLLSFLSQFL